MKKLILTPATLMNKQGMKFLQFYITMLSYKSCIWIIIISRQKASLELQELYKMFQNHKTLILVTTVLVKKQHMISPLLYLVTPIYRSCTLIAIGLRTPGMSVIAKAIQHTSTLTVFSISNNSVVN